MDQMEMEEDIELEEYHDQVEEAITPYEHDPIYEFDAPQYYDFSQPETHLQAQEAERWFDYAGIYPPSPFIRKLNVVMNSTSMETTVVAVSDQDSNPESGRKFGSRRAAVVRSCSTLMKPTVSHLAKHRTPQEIKILSLKRSQKLHMINGTRTTSSPSDNNATKRQKLEIGYLKKDALLKHQTVLSHKLCNKATDNNRDQVNSSRPKVTVPKEPQLETARRALRRSRSKMSAESSESTTKSNLQQPPKLPRRFMSRKTVKSEDSQDASEQKIRQVAAAEASNSTTYESPYRFKAHKLEKGPNKFTKERHDAAVPIRLFEKMRLEPEAHNHSKSLSKS